MPLSEHEERVLAEIERQLAAEDPGFVARTRRGARPRARAQRPHGRTRIVLAAVGVVVGLVSLLALTYHVAFGLAGFAILLGSTTVLVQALRAEAESRAGRDDARGQPGGKSGPPPGR